MSQRAADVAQETTDVPVVALQREDRVSQVDKAAALSTAITWRKGQVLEQVQPTARRQCLVSLPDAKDKSGGNRPVDIADGCLDAVDSPTLPFEHHVDMP